MIADIEPNELGVCPICRGEVNSKDVSCSYGHHYHSGCKPKSCIVCHEDLPITSFEKNKDAVLTFFKKHKLKLIGILTIMIMLIINLLVYFNVHYPKIAEHAKYIEGNCRILNVKVYEEIIKAHKYDDYYLANKWNVSMVYTSKDTKLNYTLKSSIDMKDAYRFGIPTSNKMYRCYYYDHFHIIFSTVFPGEFFNRLVYIVFLVCFNMIFPVLFPMIINHVKFWTES